MSDEGAGDGRPAAILAATRKAVLDRGLSGVRVADIAALANISTAAVHYHFDTKEDVLTAAFRWSAERLFETVEERLASEDDDVGRLRALLELSVPEEGLLRDEYVIWLQFWAQVVVTPSLLGTCEEVSKRWRSAFYRVIESGSRSGAFRPVVAAEEVADRVLAMVDGLGFETAVGYGWTSPSRMRELLGRFASEQLGVEIVLRTDDELARRTEGELAPRTEGEVERRTDGEIARAMGER